MTCRNSGTLWQQEGAEHCHRIEPSIPIITNTSCHTLPPENQDHKQKTIPLFRGFGPKWHPIPDSVPLLTSAHVAYYRGYTISLRVNATHFQLNWDKSHLPGPSFSSACVILQFLGDMINMLSHMKHNMDKYSHVLWHICNGRLKRYKPIRKVCDSSNKNGYMGLFLLYWVYPPPNMCPTPLAWVHWSEST